MRTSQRRWAEALSLVVLCAALASCGGSSGSGPALPLRVVTDIPLPGGTSRFDYQDVDAAHRRLFVAHLGASRIDVVDLDALQAVGGIDGVASVHGVRVAADIGRLFASATGSNEVATIDTASLTVIARTPTGAFPDGVAYDAPDHKIYVSDESGGDETVLAAGDGRALGRLPLGGEAGNVAYDPLRRRVLVDVQTRNELAVIDPTGGGTGTIEQRVPLPGCRNNHGLQVDATAALLYVACVDNATLLVLDETSLAVLGRFGIGSDADVLALDDPGRRLYVAAESGVVAMFAIEGRALRKLGQGHLASKAHAVAVDPLTHRVFLPLEKLHGRPVLRVMAPT